MKKKKKKNVTQDRKDRKPPKIINDILSGSTVYLSIFDIELSVSDTKIPSQWGHNICHLLGVLLKALVCVSEELGKPHSLIGGSAHPCFQKLPPWGQ